MIFGFVVLFGASQSCLNEAIAAQGSSELLSPGQSAMYRDLEVTLLSLKKASDYINPPDQGRVYAVLKIKVKNTGTEENSARLFSDLQWLDQANGMRDGTARTTGVTLNNPESWELTPGSENEFEDVYMLPDTMTEAEFHMMKGYNPQPLARWTMVLQ